MAVNDRCISGKGPADLVRMGITGAGSEGMNYEYAPMRLPSNVDRLTATAQLTIQAEYADWELTRVRLFPDGTRKVLLRRPATNELRPGLSY